MPPDYTSSMPITGPYDLAATLWPSSMGSGNPCQKIDGPTQARLAVNTPGGPAAMRVQHTNHTDTGEQLNVELTGEGAEWLRPHLPAYFGLDFQPPKISGLRKLRQIAYDMRGLRMIRLPRIYTPLVQIVLQQLISYRDACYGWRKLAQRYGTPVPGYDDLWYPPAPAALAMLHSHHFIECGVLPQHGRRIVEVSRAAERIEAAWSAGHAEDAVERTSRLLIDLPGIGPWTVGSLRGAFLGDVDAEVLGDYSLPKLISYFFEGAEAIENQDPTDDDMLRLLEPYRPHRYYVLMLLTRGAKHPPRRGPHRKSLRERFR